MKNILLTSLFILVSTVIVAQVSSKEKQALLDFYHATNGDTWAQSWDINTPVANWQGVTVENNKVTAIRLLFNNIEGTLPASMSDLGSLKILELSFNKISGELPKSFGKMSELEVLALNGNYITGEIPKSYGNMKNLKQLHLSSNQLTGQVPASLAGLDQLVVFNVFDNNLSGELPAQLAEIRTLREFMVAENDFSNTEHFSVILLINTANLNLNETTLIPSARSVTAIETSDDDN